MTRFLAAFDVLAAESQEIFLRKNADYGDCFRNHGLLGVLVRLSDKLARAGHLLDLEDGRMVRSETLRDTLLDLSNYALMGAIVYDLDRPGVVAQVWRSVAATGLLEREGGPSAHQYRVLAKERRIMARNGHDHRAPLARHGLGCLLVLAEETLTGWISTARVDTERRIWTADTRRELLSLSILPLTAIIDFEEVAHESMSALHR